MKTILRRTFWRARPASPWNSRKPVREELFSVERLEEHARSLALAQSVKPKPDKGYPLTGRLADNATVLLNAHRTINRAIDEGRAITPAAEWLLDNYYLVERQIHDIRANLPASYYRQLPKLITGPFAGYPRVFGVAWAFVAHTDSHFDSEMLCRYARAYQDVQPLTIGELWALAITLRVVLIENLRRLADEILINRAARQDADALADRLLGSADRVAEPLSALLKDYEHGPLIDAFAVQLIYRLRDQDPRVTPALTWLDHRLALQETTADVVVSEVHQRQGAANVTVRNIITSMRLVSSVDWTELVERISLVDEVLAAGSDFAQMDFPTRNLYRSAIETLARGANRTEIDVAHCAVAAARNAAETKPPSTDGRSGTTGYHLIAGGRRSFEATIDYRLSLREWPLRLNQTFGIGGYAAAITLTAAAVLAVPLLMLAGAGIGVVWLGLLGLVGAIPALDLAVALVNREAASRFGAALLPALDLRDGIPRQLRTLVAVPTLLTTLEAIEEQVERLEVHYLASPEGDLLFALLSDWTDALGEHAEGDDELLAAAARGIADLNTRHGPAPGGERFRLLHRRRIWNPGEGRWIGWERKRGKLHELNRLLRGATDTTFLEHGAAGPGVATDVRYVVTLDADTRLPRDTVRRLIGKMAHPLNRPRFDVRTGRVVEGHAVMQPRVTPSLPVGREGSLFQRTFSSMSGIDPYAAAVSDVYQDLFDEGSYSGKGIYDVDAFEAALAGRVPDSTLLSHDLFEGVFARAALVSDVEVVEEFPSRYDVDALRHHRWARGDWQLLPWILGFGPVPIVGGRPGSIPVIGRLKMLDNLRRTLSAPAAIVALLVGWQMSFDNALVWTAFVLATIALPSLLPALGALRLRPKETTGDSHLRAIGGDFRLALTQAALRIVFLAHQAGLMIDAIVRTLFRLTFTRRHLLEWVTAAQATIDARLDIAGFYFAMTVAPAVALLALLSGAQSGRGTWPLSVTFAAIWLASPAIARWISLSPLAAHLKPVSDAEARLLRLTARRTWRYFERFVTPADNMLPPDNFQEDPAALARRTSPTNIGLYLLSAASARDFGWIGSTDAVQRMEATFATLGRMERFRGHFYNWYATQDLRPLDPRYVSSVDSGNLAGHLIALANACREWRRQPLTDARRLAGIADALDLAREEASQLNDGRRTQTVSWQQLDGAIAALATGTLLPPTDGENLTTRLAGLASLADTMADIARALASERGEDKTTASGSDLLFWAAAAQRAIESHRRDLESPPPLAATVDSRLAALETAARAMALGMEFGFMLDPERKLLSIGYLVPEGVLDTNCYDLLASEARLASFFAIAKGDVPAKHWFRLGRAVTPIAHGAALISWSGSMFEYLMPSLVMRAPAGSLLEQTTRLIVRRQIGYGATLGIPWGVSESAYNVRDLELTYQYSNFGVPGLGLKRGLADNAVIAPYATALATMVDPRAAVRNFTRLAAIGACGRYGYYEALDYTPVRLQEGETVAVVRAYMAHHQGMSILAIADTLLDGVMRSRFHSEPIIQATELLLQERTPRDVAVLRPLAAEAKSEARILGAESSASRQIVSAQGATPATHLLSNGQYSVMLTAAGSGYSRWRDLAVTRWREDATCDDWGSYVFLRDIGSGKVWSAAFQPTGEVPDASEIVFKEDRAEFTRRDGKLTTVLEVLVSAEDAGEVRRVSVSNLGSQARDIEITSYAELVLAPLAADIAHPAFSKLFLETEYLADLGIVLATRRRRAPNEPEIWAAHFAVVDGTGVEVAIGRPEIETDRARFIGRGGNMRTPVAVIDGRPLSNSVGTVLDAIFALRRRLRIAPGATARIAFWTLVASSREAVLDLADTHRDVATFGRAATLAWTQAQVQLHHLGIDPGEAGLFQRLAGHLIYATPSLRSSSETIRRGAGGQPGLWSQGISGDLPIMLLRIAETDNLDVARQVLQAHEYWRMKGLAVDVVILNERASSYVQDLQIALETMVRISQSRPQVSSDAPSGRVYIVRADLITLETRALLASVARVVLVGHHGSIADQLDRAPEVRGSARLAPRQALGTAQPPLAPPLPELEFFNGLGGFADGGREYVTILGPGQSTPAPWINVIANPAFGFQVATEGSGYSWSVNSRENQLTPWSNDPVIDRPGEALYLHDVETGELWSATASPIRDREVTYIARHGRGYSRFTHSARGIAVDLLQYVPLEDPIKISRLKLRNTSGRTRHLSLTAYAEWVLGPSRSASLAYVTTEIDAGTGALFARNPWNPSFGSRVAFLDFGGRQKEWTGDRREFIGRNGSLASPAALTRLAALSGKLGAGLDPCGALRTSIELPPNGAVEIVCFLGQAASAQEAAALINRYRAADLDAVLAEVGLHWDTVLGSVQVKTPDRSMDIMLNGWLLYQTLACRVWARSAFYQASGAYGFRDQIQDGIALTGSRPAATREHLLRAAGRQFVEGDVQHWWLPHSGQGVRTRISDDRSWLAYAVANYVQTAGDTAVLDELVPFLEGQKLAAGEHDAFFYPTLAEESASLFEHCARGLDHSLALGVHGLPLMGTGDWNDGMNRIGEGGRGESVWLGWFLHKTLDLFVPIAEARGETARADSWRTFGSALQASLEREAWDGDWYRRGFYDDGTPLGSVSSEECRIDSIAQSWAVLSGAAEPARAAGAMAALDRELIRPADGLALLFAPPFDKTPLEPGYIKGYPPGVRENGGQYTHAAMWSVIAFAELGDGDKAAGLFSLLNPINHTRSRADVYRYKVEPYVVAADIYGAAPHVGRGGWTWYTGSAGWMQRAGIEAILGLRLEGDILLLDPCIPKHWPGFELALRHGSARYEIKVENSAGNSPGNSAGLGRGIVAVTVDDEVVNGRPLRVELQDDGRRHRIAVHLG